MIELSELHVRTTHSMKHIDSARAFKLPAMKDESKIMPINANADTVRDVLPKPNLTIENVTARMDT